MRPLNFTVRRLKMATRHPNWSQRVAKRLEWYLAENFGAPSVRFRIGLATIRRELLREHASSMAQREIRRRCAEMYCSHCLEKSAPWPTVKRALLALDAVGYTNVERRAHFAILVGKYAASEERAVASATARAADALRGVRRVKRGQWRKQFEAYLRPLAHRNGAQPSNNRWRGP